MADLQQRRRLTLAATSLGSALAFIDTTIVVVAMPTIDRDLDLGLSGEQWLYLAYGLSLSALYLVSGAIGDRFGLRACFVAGAALFALASGLCALAPDEGVLIAARALQGVGGALLTTNSLALLRVSYRGEAGRAIGLWTSLTSLAAVAGPPTGGAIVEWVSWRWIFVVNLPLAGCAILLAIAGRVAEEQPREKRPLDVVGSAIVGVGLSALTYALVQGAEHGVGAVWWAAVVAALALPAFAVWTAHTHEPLVPLSLFGHLNIAAANVVTFLVYAGLGAFIVFVPLYLQFLGFTPFESGLALAPSSLVIGVLGPRFGAFADRTGPRIPLAVGSALIGVGMAVILLVGTRSAIWTTGIPGLALFALGLAMVVAPITAAALAFAPERLAGVASGVNQTVARVGGLIAVAVVGVVVTLVFEAAGGHGETPFDRDLDATHPSVTAFRSGMAVAAALALAGALVAALWISDSRPTRRRR